MNYSLDIFRICCLLAQKNNLPVPLSSKLHKMLELFLQEKFTRTRNEFSIRFAPCRVIQPLKSIELKEKKPDGLA